MSSMASALALPAVVAAVALYPLATMGTALDDFADLFFNFSPVEQGAVLALLFSVVFGGVAVIVSATSSGGSSGSAAKSTVSYPIDDMVKAKTEKDQFLALYPMLRNDILAFLKTNHEMKEEPLDWMTQMMDYTVPGGKLNRGTTVLSVTKTLNPAASPTLQAQACVLGWTIEFLQAFFLVADDVMDESQTRRGQPCWYKQPHVQLIAINDSFLLESFCFTLLKQHFGHDPAMYAALVDLLLKVIQKTEVGQLLDLTSQPMTNGSSNNSAVADLNRFTLERYRQIVKYKTAYYTFYLPVAMGMILNKISSPASFQTAERICMEMGEYFQIQDDYLDCYGTPEVIGKIGTDIQDNKCSWLVVQALDRCSADQKKLLINNYGKWDDKKVQRVKELYTTLGLPKVFTDYEEASYASIQKELDGLTELPRDVFELLLKKIYKRNK